MEGGWKGGGDVQLLAGGVGLMSSAILFSASVEVQGVLLLVMVVQGFNSDSAELLIDPRMAEG